MMVLERRASAVLFNLLRSRPVTGRWLLPANVCTVVPLTFRLAEVPYEFVDISGPGLSIDAERCLDLAAIGDVAGVLLVRTYGARLAAPFLDELRTSSPDTLVIDDRCLCRPTTTEPEPAAHATLWSTGYAKYLDLGFGGFARLGDAVPYQPHPRPFSEPALERLDEDVKAAVADGTPFPGAGGDWLDLGAPPTTWTAHRDAVEAALSDADVHKAQLNETYRELVPAEAQLPAVFHDWRFQISVARAEDLLEKVFAEGLFASRHYASLGPALSLQGSNQGFPRAELLHRHVVNLFNDRYFDRARAERLGRLVRDHVAAHGPGPRPWEPA